MKCIHLLIVIKKYAVESIQFYQENWSYLQIIAFKNSRKQIKEGLFTIQIADEDEILEKKLIFSHDLCFFFSTEFCWWWWWWDKTKPFEELKLSEKLKTTSGFTSFSHTHTFNRVQRRSNASECVQIRCWPLISRSVLFLLLQFLFDKKK